MNTTTVSPLTDEEKSALIGTRHVVEVEVRNIHHGDYARVRVPGGRFVLVPVSDLRPGVSR